MKISKERWDEIFKNNDEQKEESHIKEVKSRKKTIKKYIYNDTSEPE